MDGFPVALALRRGGGKQLQNGKHNDSKFRSVKQTKKKAISSAKSIETLSVVGGAAALPRHCYLCEFSLPHQSGMHFKLAIYEDLCY
jgi:hypothetical protein